MELWSVYDVHRNKTSKTMPRGSKFAKGDYHQVIHVCIFNSKEEMLIQQRQPFKQGWSNLWDLTVGGSAVAGDNSQQAASRELFEEIGYKYDFTNIAPHFSITFEFGFDDYYLIEKDLDLDSLILQQTEVQAVKWASKDEILSMIDNNIFIPYHKSIILLCFDLRKNYSAIRS